MDVYKTLRTTVQGSQGTASMVGFHGEIHVGPMVVVHGWSHGGFHDEIHVCPMVMVHGGSHGGSMMGSMVGPWRAQSRVISLGGSVSLFSRAPNNLSMCAATTRHSSSPCRRGPQPLVALPPPWDPHHGCPPSIPNLLQLQLGDAVRQEVTQGDLHIGVAGPGRGTLCPCGLDLLQ